MDVKNAVTKPMTLLKEEFIENLAELCNSAGLPFFIIESILKDFMSNVHIASQKQYEADKAQYEQELRKLQPSSLEESGD